jgi:hypothetical protein
MAKDPAFLFYYDRFLSGTISMTDSEVGQYVRLMCIQANKGHVTKKDMFHICKSYDNDVCLKFANIGDDKFANTVLTEIVEQRKNYTESRRNNRKGTKSKKTSSSYVPHMVNVNKDVDVNKEEILKEYDYWTNQITEGNDQYFEQMFMKEQIPQSPNIQFWIMDHRDLLNRYPKMRPPTQDAFRKSCLKHIRENYKKPITPNGGATKKEQHAAATVDFIAKHYGAKSG